MNNQEFDKIIAEAKLNHPYWFELSEENERISANDVARVEEIKSLIFPVQYKRFATKYGVGEFAFTYVYSPLLTGGWSLWEPKESYSLPNEFIPISDNGGGDYLGFIVQNGQCPNELYWADHEQSYSIEISEYKCFYDFIVKVGLDYEE